MELHDTAVRFHELSVVEEREEVTVGRLSTGVYVVLPTDGAALLGRLMEGARPQTAAKWYEAEYGESVDVDDFIESLRQLGFVRSDGDEQNAPQERALRWQRLGRAMFSPTAWPCYAVIAAAWAVAVVHHRDLLPSPYQVFFVRSLVVVQLTVIFAQTPLIAMHEAFHVLAGRRLGLPSQLGVSNRLIDVVFETRMNGLLSVARARRYLPLLAGMLCDVVICCLLALLADATRLASGELSLCSRVCLALAFTCVVRLAWQFQLYLRTDLYYVVATALNCHDLHDAGLAQLRNRVWRLLGHPDRALPLDRWTDRDLRTGLWYGPVAAVGIVTLLAVTVYGSVPILLQYVYIVVGRLAGGHLDGAFWDAVASLALNALNVVLLVVISHRKRAAAGVPTP
jgi:hypothetical protein